MLGNERENNLQKNREAKPGLNFSDLAVPLISILILVLMIAFVYSPLLTEASNMNDEIITVKEKQTKLTTLLSTVSKVDQSKLGSDYQLMSKMVPSRLEVANFAFYVDELAVTDNLELNQISATSAKSQITKAEGTEDDSVFTVSGPLKYQGSYENIVKFLDELQASSPYVITADNINLTQNIAKVGEAVVTTEDWSLELQISGYYMVPQQNTRVDIYLPLSPYTNNGGLLDTLRARGSIL